MQTRHSRHPRSTLHFDDAHHAFVFMIGGVVMVVRRTPFSLRISEGWISGSCICAAALVDARSLGVEPMRAALDPRIRAVVTAVPTFAIALRKDQRLPAIGFRS
jgi:hypothetical protein